ncbi:unnamed protein product [Linum tenue]|uniref:HMA domain-containing protein n=1 Tax=Linum tenue TaxID=586396 RepID=A0AAV0MWP1_9ROSI|nr:unnamed protein product [Linum tenue]
MAKTLQKSYFDVLGICCSSEVPMIENILKPLAGVTEVSVIVPTRTVIVVHDAQVVSDLDIVKALNRARLQANVRVDGKGRSEKHWPSPYAVGSGILLLLSFVQFAYRPFRWVALGAVAVGIVPVMLKCVVSVRSLRIDTNILVLIAVAGTVGMGDYIEAGTIVFLFTIAEWLESRASHKAKAAMSVLMSMAPQKAVLAETGEEVEVDKVELNTILAVKAGETIPIDGIVVNGQCEVDEKTLTGESFPVSKQTDSTVWAGTINLNGHICIKTTSKAEDCVVAKMAKLVEAAQNSKSQTQRFIDRCAQYYTPAVIIISAAIALLPLAFQVHDKSRWFRLALVVLVSACPCALILSTPVATYCALTRAATAGVLIKGGDHLETLAKIKIMAFDKTGTITTGEFTVSDFHCLQQHDVNPRELAYWVSSIESKSSHPMAVALVEYSRSIGIEPSPDNVVDFQNFPGEGIHGKIDGRAIYIGNKRIAARAGCKTGNALEEDSNTGKTIGYVYAGSTLVGKFSLSDTCRTGAAEALKDLSSMGIKSAMLTGDRQAAAWHVEKQLGNAFHAVRAELLPEDKATIIKEFKAEGPTAMIGDGLNDAPALATADVGISMGISGSALATETGHVILMSNDIRKVPEAIRLARKCYRKVIENTVMSMSTKAAVLVFAVAMHPLVWLAVLADVGTCLLVILNSMLLLHGATSQQKSGKCCDGHNHSHDHQDSKSHGQCHGHDHGAHHCHGHNHPPSHSHSHSHGHSACSHSHGHDHGHSSPNHNHDGAHNHNHAHSYHAHSHDHSCQSHDHSGHSHGPNGAGHKHSHQSHGHNHTHSHAHGGHCGSGHAVEMVSHPVGFGSSIIGMSGSKEGNHPNEQEKYDSISLCVPNDNPFDPDGDTHQHQHDHHGHSNHHHHHQGDGQSQCKGHTVIDMHGNERHEHH